jgi:ankyrin repeat protein
MILSQVTQFNINFLLYHCIKNYAKKITSKFLIVVELLDSNMFDVNCLDDKQRTCLHIASSRGNLEIVRVLLDYGASPNIRDCVGNLPIHLAIISSQVPVVTLLLESGTDIHSLDLNGKTVLHLAGTRLRWLLNDENSKASPKLKFEAIMVS